MNIPDMDFSSGNLNDVREKALEIIFHDVKNLLTNINAASELLLLNELSDGEKKRLVKIINNAAKEMEVLVKGQTLIVKIEQGTYVPALKSQELASRIQKLLEEYNHALTEKNIAIHKSFEAENLMLKTDWFCLTAALRNVLKNAIQASPESAEIKIRVYQNHGLNIEIHNEGAIPDEVVPQFFNKYISSKTRKKGLGLGTYITKKMVNALNGDVSFTTSRQDGTTIFIKLPETVIMRK